MTGASCQVAGPVDAFGLDRSTHNPAGENAEVPNISNALLLRDHSVLIIQTGATDKWGRYPRGWAAR